MANPTTGWVVSNGQALPVVGGPSPAVVGAPLYLTQLRTTAPASLPKQAIFIDGYSVPGDGGGGTFVWNNTDTTPDDGGTVLAVSGVATGRWNRQFAGAMSVKWFGAKGDGQRVTDGAMSLSPSDPTLLTCNSSAKFSATDVGKLILVQGAGAAGATLATTIASYVDSKHVHTAAPALTAVTGAVVRWGTNDKPAILAAGSTAKTSASVPGFYSSSSTLFFPPGDYLISSALPIDATWVGVQFEGSSQGQGATVIPVQTSKITLAGNDTAVIKNTSASNTWRNLWFDGGRIASRAVIDYEYFSDHQSYYDCMFDAPSSQGVIHYYGQDNGALEIDNIQFWNCFLYSDFYDASWVIQAYVWNVNGNAFQINYYDGFWEGTVVKGMYFAQGSVNLHGTQVYGWVSDFLHIYGNCALTELEDVYTEQTAGNFINYESNGTGVADDTQVVLRRCHLNAPTSIVWGCMQPLIIEDSEIGGNVTVDLTIATPATGYDYRPVICRNLRFWYPQLGFILNGGAIMGQHVQGSWYNVNSGQGQLITDGAISSNSNLLTSPGNHLSIQNVGLLVAIPGAGAALAGTVHVTNGQPGIVFSQVQTLAAGTILMFASQAGTPYTLQSTIINQTAATLGSPGGATTNYTGSTNAATTTNLPLTSRIKAFDNAGQVELTDNAVGSVSGQTVVYTALPIRYQQIGNTCVQNSSGYDHDGWLLASSAYQVPIGLNIKILSADTHVVQNLTADRSTTLSGNSIQIGSRMTITRVGSTDAHVYTVNFANGSLTLRSGQKSDFEYVLNAGWLPTTPNPATPVIQTGTVTLSSGTGTVNTGITITAVSQIYLTLLVASSVANTVRYQALTANMVVGGPGVGSFQCSATKTDGTTNGSDGSTLGYMIVG